MDYHEDPIIGVSASTLSLLIGEHRNALESLKECDQEWRDERDKVLAQRDVLHERVSRMRAELADMLGLPIPVQQQDGQLVEAMRNALAVTTVHLPAGTVVLDHESARHALVEKIKQADTPFGDRVHVHAPGDPAHYNNVAMWSVSTEPWRAGDIIRYADEQGPVVDAELTMRERDEDDLTWVARVVTVHRVTSTDGDQELYWAVGASLYPVEQDARFTKLRDPIHETTPATPRLAVADAAIGQAYDGETPVEVLKLGGKAYVGDPTDSLFWNRAPEHDDGSTRIEPAEQDSGPDTQAMPPLVMDDPWAEPGQVADHG